MTEPDFNRMFERFNAAQMRADRATDRVYSWAMIAGLFLSAVCIAVVLSDGVQ